MPYKNKQEKNEYDKDYRQKNKEKLRRQHKLWYIENKTGANQRSRERRKKLFDKWLGKAIEGYGGKCSVCGENRSETLVFHHVNGGGKEHRRITGSDYGFYKWLVENNFPSEIELLCANCHLVLHRRIDNE